METEQILKWINELQCEIDRLKKSVGGGGGGSSTVVVTPETIEGAKVADISVDGVTKSLFSGLPFGLSETECKIGNVGTKDLYAKYLTGNVSSDETTLTIAGMVELIGVIGVIKGASYWQNLNFFYSTVDFARVQQDIGTATGLTIFKKGSYSTYRMIVFYTKNTSNTKKARTKK